MAISDVVTTAELPKEARNDLALIADYVLSASLQAVKPLE